MTTPARLPAALLGAIAPALALAQAALGGEPAPPTTNRTWGWLWIVAAVLVVVALFALFFARPNDRTRSVGRRP